MWKKSRPLNPYLNFSDPELAFLLDFFSLCLSHFGPDVSLKGLSCVSTDTFRLTTERTARYPKERTNPVYASHSKDAFLPRFKN